MTRGTQYTAEQFIQAIEGSGGIISSIARKMGCSWNTAQKWINDHATVKAAYTAEQERQLDMAEGAVLQNIKIAVAKQQMQFDEKGKLKIGAEIADTGDAKWYLSKKGEIRGYGDLVKIQLGVEKELEKALADLRSKLPPNVFAQVLKALAGEDSTAVD